MTVDEKLILDDLQTLGLTKNEGKVLISLVKLNRSVGASRIASESDVPRSKIYQALEGLEEKKIVTKDEIKGSANVYRLLFSPAQILTHLKQIKVNPIEEAVERSSENLLNIINSIGEEEGIDELFLIKGLVHITKTAKEIIDAANYLVISNLFPYYLEPLTTNLIEAKKRGTHIKLINLDEEIKELSKKILIDSISTETRGISIETLKHVGKYFMMDEEEFSLEAITFTFEKFLQERPNFLLIDPNSENANAILILMDPNDLANSNAVQTRNQSFIRSIDRLVDFVINFAGNLRVLLENLTP